MGAQCQAFVDDLLASHSTDLQQRAYELQAFLALSPDIVASVMPENSSSEEIEVHHFPPLTVYNDASDWSDSSAAYYN